RAPRWRRRRCPRATRSRSPSPDRIARSPSGSPGSQHGFCAPGAGDQPRRRRRLLTRCAFPGNARRGSGRRRSVAGGLVALFDDVAALAKAAAASLDDVGAAAGRAGVKAAGVVVDDTAVTPQYVHGLAAERELPIIRRIALGSVRNKLLVLLPAVLLLSQFLPVLLTPILMVGGGYLCYEGAEKVWHRLRPHAEEHAAGAEALPD